MQNNLLDLKHKNYSRVFVKALINSITIFCSLFTHVLIINQVIPIFHSQLLLSQLLLRVKGELSTGVHRCGTNYR